MGEPEGATTVENEEEKPRLDELEDDDESEEGSEQSEPEEPVRRRLVSELLEGQDEIVESLAGVVVDRIQVEAVDAGGAIYQLDLDGSEPQGKLVEPERPPEAAAALLAEATQELSQPADAADACEAFTHLIHERDLLIMRAERDGIGAYELATGVGEFVDILLATVHRYDDDNEEEEEEEE